MHNTNVDTLRDRPAEICLRIKNWDLQNVSVLIALIDDLEEALYDLSSIGENVRPASDWIDFCDLPSADIPKWVDTGYPVWAADKNGMLMIESDPFRVVSLAQMRSLQGIHSRSLP